MTKHLCGPTTLDPHQLEQLLSGSRSLTFRRALPLVRMPQTHCSMTRSSELHAFY